MKKKLLLVSSYSIHLLNYYDLIQDYFDEILVISNKEDTRFSQFKQVDFSFKNTFSSIKEIRKTSLEFSPSIIHIHQANTVALQVILAINRYKIPTLLTFLGSDVLHTPTRSIFHRWMLKFIVNNINFFTSDSLHMAEVAQGYMNSKKKILIANFGIKSENIENTSKQNIIYSNRLHKKFYRVDMIIDEFYNFLNSKATKDWKLIIGAIGEETESLKDKVKKLEIESNVEFVGWVDAKSNAYYYSISKVFVAIPENDATSISLLEAMYYGCIPFVINVPSNREWIIDQFNGFLVDDVYSHFFKNIEQLKSDSIASVNTEIIKLKGTKDVNKEKFISFYEEVFSDVKNN
jgi:glycosyltransferase involved in cell wall biosynthesis